MRRVTKTDRQWLKERLLQIEENASEVYEYLQADDKADGLTRSSATLCGSGALLVRLTLQDLGIID